MMLVYVSGACAGVEVRDVDVAKGILTAILEGHVEGLADTEDMEYDDADEEHGGQNRRRCISIIISSLSHFIKASCSLHKKSMLEFYREVLAPWQEGEN